MLLAASFTDPSFALSFWTAVTFALLIVMMGKFAWGPILAMLETREKTIAEAIESAQRERAGAEKAATERRLTPAKGRAGAAGPTGENGRAIAAAQAVRMDEAHTESRGSRRQARK